MKAQPGPTVSGRYRSGDIALSWTKEMPLAAEGTSSKSAPGAARAARGRTSPAPARPSPRRKARRDGRPPGLPDSMPRRFPATGGRVYPLQRGEQGDETSDGGHRDGRRRGSAPRCGRGEQGGGEEDPLRPRRDAQRGEDVPERASGRRPRAASPRRDGGGEDRGRDRNLHRVLRPLVVPGAPGHGRPPHYLRDRPRPGGRRPQELPAGGGGVARDSRRR